MKANLLILFLFVANFIFAQNNIKGLVVNSSDKTPLTNVSIVLLRTDSILEKFVRTDDKGLFSIDEVNAGNYILLATYPKFEIFSQKISINDKTMVLDSIKIESQANLLEEIIVTHKVPIKFKGDTIEYDASSFETEQNAKLEDLLRRLPGLSVSSSGEITAHGKSVSKVLIDGEEFFGYDPKIAIRNVRADAIDKVQVYERKSEEAELTGIDDGVRLQTVNVILKEEARKGIFGNVNTNFGTQQLFDNKLFTALFNRSERIGITGNWNNMGNAGDASRIRSNNQITGKPEHKSAGVNYDNVFFERKLQLNSSYNFNNNSNENESKSYNKQILDDNKSLETTQRSESFSGNKNNTLRAQVRYRLDSVSNLNLHIDGKVGRGESSSNSESETRREQNSLANDFNSNNRSSSKEDNINIRANYRRVLNKNGRNVNLHFNTNHDNSESSSRVEENTNFFDNVGNLERSKNINQLRLNKSVNKEFGTDVNLTEHLGQSLFLILGYQFSTSSRVGKVDAYNNVDNHTFNILDSIYSKNEENINTSNGVQFNLNYNNDKITLNLSNHTNYRHQELKDSYRNIALERYFWQNSTIANILYRINNNKILNFSYQNSSNNPSFNQLQPIQPPTNELYQQLGNPDLKRETRNAVTVNFNKFNIFKGSSLNFSVGSNLTSNAIVNNSIIDDNGKTTATFVNINDRTNWNANFNSNYVKPIFNGLIQFGPTADLYYNNNYQYINGELNKSNSTNATIGLNANKQNSKIIDFNLNLNIGLADEQNSVQKQYNNTNLTSSINTDIKYFLPFKFYLTQVIAYSYSGKTKVFPKPIQQFYMNLELTKKLLQNESLLLSIKGFDIFNSFNNINRSFSGNNFSESERQVLTQYFMIGLKWDFNKNLGKKNE